MIQLPPEREQIAFEINVGMWGEDLAALYQRNGDVRWLLALKAADALLAKYGPPEPSRRIFPDGERHGFLKPAGLRSGHHGPSVRYEPEYEPQGGN